MDSASFAIQHTWGHLPKLFKVRKQPSKEGTVAKRTCPEWVGDVPKLLIATNKERKKRNIACLFRRIFAGDGAEREKSW